MAFGDSLGFLDKPMRKVTYLDGTATPLECEVVYIDGDVTIAGLMQYLNEQVVVGGGGQYHGIVHGDAAFPTVTITGKIDKFSSGVTSAGTIIDFWQATTGTLYAAAVDATPAGALAGREKHRHVLIEYQKTDTVTSYIALESCTMDSFEFGDEEKGQVQQTHTCRGRVWADGVMIAGRIKASTTAPTWLPT